MSDFIVFLVSLPEAILAVILINEKLRKNPPKDD
ncbi:hypothetical protein F4555_002064 [Mobiluncus mulieris]|nr:hypothetical protein [Mobiluncus mulieris]